MAKKKEKSTQLVTFVLDKTASMLGIRGATIEAFNTYLGSLKDDKESDTDFTLVMFNTDGIDKVHFEKPIKEVPLLTKETYPCGGGTPLIEAATKTIRALEKAVAQKKNKPKVVVCIQTDGEENSSNSEYTWASLKALVEEKTSEGWAFNFMGAGINAYDQGIRMGFSRGATVSYDANDLAATRSVFASTAENTKSFLAGKSMNTSYSMAQKMDAGDAFDTDLTPTPLPGVVPSGTLKPSPFFSRKTVLHGGKVFPDTKTNLDLTRRDSGSTADDGLDLTK